MSTGSVPFSFLMTWCCQFVLQSVSTLIRRSFPKIWTNRLPKNAKNVNLRLVQEKRDVTLPCWQNFCINNLSWQRWHLALSKPWKKKYGLPFCSWVQWCTGKSFVSYLQDHGLLRSGNFASMATWRNDFSVCRAMNTWHIVVRWS